MKSRTTWTMAATLFLVTLAVYARVVFFPFCIIDDAAYVTDNPHVTGGFTLDGVKWAFTSFHAGNWHPVTWLSLMLDGQLFGLNPAGFHLVNVLLHGLNTSLLFLLLRSSTGTAWSSLFVAACFGLHPLHVESVAWIAERKDVLSTLFLMLTLLAYGRYARVEKRGMYLLSLALFALGLMAKPMLVTVPVLLLLFDYWPLQRLTLRPGRAPGRTEGAGGVSRFLLEKVPFLVLAAATSAVTLFAQKPSISSLATVPLSDRVANALWAVLVYLAEMVYPIDLAVLYPLVRLPWWQPALGAAVLVAVTVLVVRQMENRGYLATGWLWYLVTLLPVIGIIQVGRQSTADRYTYIPLIGLFIIAGWGGAELCQRFRKLKKPVAVLAAAVVAGMVAGTSLQLGYWRDNMELIRHTLQATDADANYYAHYLLGMLHEKEGRQDLAVAEYRESIRIEPRDPLVHFDLGYIFDQQDRTAEAIAEYREVVTLDPAFAQGHFSLGIVLERTGRIGEAIVEFREALRLEPDNPKFLNNFGILLARQGMLDEAVEAFSRALQVNPADEKAGENLQIALRQKTLAAGR